MNNRVTNLFQIIKDLRLHTAYPAVSIFMPTAQSIPGKLQDRIRLKDLIIQARDALLQQMSQREAEPLLERMHAMVDGYDFEMESLGLALFANPSFGVIVRLPFTIQKHVTVDKDFHISSLLRELHQSNHYWVLELTKKMCRLYEGFNDTLTEKITPETDALGNPVQGFPLDYIRPNDSLHDAIGTGDRDARYLDDHEKRYFSVVDTELGKALHEKPLPVVVCGVDKNMGLFRTITKNGHAIIGYQHGDFQNTRQLAEAVAPILKEQRETEIKKLLERFVEAEGDLKQAFGLHRVWLMAHEGRIDYVLIEEGFSVPGVVDSQDPSHIIIADKKATGNTIQNLIDCLIERVIETRGHVVFVPKGALKDFENVGAILRYTTNPHAKL